jgi:hypothetical protein
MSPAGSGKNDSTVKLRAPADADGAAVRVGIGDEAGPPKVERKLEGDLNVNALVKASYSATLQPPPMILSEVLTGKRPLQELFDARAVTEMSAVKWDQLRAYGPILAQKWKLPVDGLKGKVSIERWDAGGTILVEVSDKKEPEKAMNLADAMQEVMKKLGLEQLPGSKTENAMAHAPSRAVVAGGA